MKYGYRREWYEGAADTAPVNSGGSMPTRRSVVTTLSSIALCVMASVMAGAVIDGGALAADDVTPPSAAGDAIKEDAAFVMSWVYDDENDAGGEAEDSDAADEPGGDAERIRELADAYIAAHMPGGTD